MLEGHCSYSCFFIILSHRASEHPQLDHHTLLLEFRNQLDHMFCTAHLHSLHWHGIMDWKEGLPSVVVFAVIVIAIVNLKCLHLPQSCTGMYGESCCCLCGSFTDGITSGLSMLLEQLHELIIMSVFVYDLTFFVFEENR